MGGLVDGLAHLTGPVSGCGGVFAGMFPSWDVSGFEAFYGEFDPGSGRTLAACLTHASRAERPLRGYSSGERVSNTWVICPALWDKPGKLGLIPNTPCWSHGLVGESVCSGVG